MNFIAKLNADLLCLFHLGSEDGEMFVVSEKAPNHNSQGHQSNHSSGHNFAAVVESKCKFEKVRNVTRRIGNFLTCIPSNCREPMQCRVGGGA